MKFSKWKKTGGLFLSFVMTACITSAQDWTVITGRVTKVHQGAANFYTVIAQDGAEYVANSACPDGSRNESVFKDAYAAKTPLHIEFRSHEKHSGSIWYIHLIKPVSSAAEVPAATVGPKSGRVLPDKLVVSGLFKTGMVLQREMPVPVWGWAKPGTEVNVEFAGQKKTVTTGDNGQWRVTLDPLKASSVPEKMIVISSSDNQKTEIENILVGEVWVLAGQSNMDWWLEAAKGGSNAVAHADCPWLRVFSPGWQMPDEPAQDVTAGASWTVSTPDTAGHFSAIGFFFAGQLHKALGVPVGLLHTSVSGTYGECWLSREALESVSAANPRLDEYNAALKILPEETRRWEKEKAEYNQQVAEARQAGKPEPEMSFFVRKGPMGPNHFHRPYGLYNGRIAPLMPYAARGVIWYQGEGNSQTIRVGYYQELLTALINCWRQGWDRSDLPFLIVQLPRFIPGQYNDWPALRETQRKTVADVHDTALVVTIDTGETGSIHPVDKQPVGERTANLALQKVYRKDDVLAVAPAPENISRSGDALLIAFSNTGAGLSLREGTAPNCFEIAGKDGVFVPATAELQPPDKIKVSSSGIQRLVRVRYAYSNFPDVNLFNSSGIPVVNGRLKFE